MPGKRGSGRIDKILEIIADGANPFDMITIKTTAGAPSNANTKGALVINTNDDDVYICTVVSGTYVKMNA